VKIRAAKITKLAAGAFCALVFSILAAAQSTDQNFPTPITTNEIAGTIKARDVGDSRLTTYFYAFDGDQGDIFINVVSNNFSGDIDVFTVEALRPLTKMVIYANTDLNETGRLIYLRKGEKLMLRIEGRSPNDDPATFRIKFGGSFVALAPEKKDLTPKIEKAEESTDSAVTVNSVGTIIQKPKKPPVKKVDRAAKADTTAVKTAVKKTEIPKGVPVKTEEDSTPSKTEDETKPSAKIEKVGDSPAAKTGDETKPEEKSAKSDEDQAPAKTGDEAKAETVFENKSAKVTVGPDIVPETKTEAKESPKTKIPPRRSNRRVTRTPPPPVLPEEKAPDPLAAIRLVIELKDGKVIWRPMNEVLKFSVDKGVLTVIAKDGNITRYSIFDVAKVTIQ